MLLVQQIVSGLATGSLYALAALGLVLIYRTSAVVNFAHGEAAMISTFVAFTLLVRHHVPLAWAALGTMLFAFLQAAASERLLIRPLRQAPVLSVIILTLGLMFILNGVAGWIWGYEPVSFPALVPDRLIHLGGVVFTLPDVLNLGTALVIMLGFFLLFQFTLLGAAMRAVAENLGAARLVGVPVDWIMALTWGLAGVLGAAAGVLIAPAAFLDITMMSVVIIKAFTAAVLGGFDSLPGTVLGGLLLGVLENLVGGYISTELKSTFAFAVIIAVLWLRPAGLLGTVQEKKI